MSDRACHPMTTPHRKVRVADLVTGDFLAGSQTTILCRPWRARDPRYAVLRVRDRRGRERVARWRRSTTVTIDLDRSVRDEA